MSGFMAFDARDFCRHGDGVDACWRQTRSGRKLCATHERRKTTTGSCGAVEIRPWGVGTLSSHNAGYLSRYEPSHPLAAANGSVLEHRRVLFSRIGPGWHACASCGRALNWDRSWPRDGNEALVVDHKDGDRTNNAIENLRVSCQPCNRRNRARRS